MNNAGLLLQEGTNVGQVSELIILKDLGTLMYFILGNVYFERELFYLSNVFNAKTNSIWPLRLSA